MDLLDQSCFGVSLGSICTLEVLSLEALRGSSKRLGGWAGSQKGCSYPATQEGSISTGLRFHMHHSVCIHYLQQKAPLDWLFQLKNFRVQGRMHFNDSREWIKLNTLSRIFFLASSHPPAPRRASVCASWVSAPALNRRLCRATVLAKKPRARKGTKGRKRFLPLVVAQIQGHLPAR